MLSLLVEEPFKQRTLNLTIEKIRDFGRNALVLESKAPLKMILLHFAMCFLFQLKHPVKQKTLNSTMNILKDFGREGSVRGKIVAGNVMSQEIVVPGHITTVGVSSKLLLSLVKSEPCLEEYLASKTVHQQVFNQQHSPASITFLLFHFTRSSETFTDSHFYSSFQKSSVPYPQVNVGKTNIVLMWKDPTSVSVMVVT